MLPCCHAERHEWDRLEVERNWLPPVVRCLLIGENPGDSYSKYFYERPRSYDADKVAVRRALLHGLHQQGLIAEPTLEGFRDAGFLFDHAIRCHMPANVVAKEREKAKRYASTLVGGADHLRRWLSEANLVWVMGHLASNAVAKATPAFAKQERKISMPPYPGPIAADSRFFVSEYLTWCTEAKATSFAASFKRFAQERRAL
jgi:hypothetical protein